MKSQTRNNLKKELISAGAPDSEVNGLLSVARDLRQLKSAEAAFLAPILTDKPESSWRKLIPIGLTSITGLALGMALVILAQTVSPGSWLYPVQKLSDNVAMSVDPSYRGTVMMKRAQEVKQLIAGHANSNLVLATLADYQTEAATYKSVSANYAVYEYCKNNLRQAAANAPNPERQAINNALLSLKDV